MPKSHVKQSIKLIEKHVLANAFAHGGRAQVSAVIGKVLAEKPALRLHIKELSAEVRKAAKKVNAYTLKEQERRLREVFPEFFSPKKKPKKKTLPKLPSAVKGKVVMRFSPAPSGPLHIGHALPLGLNSEFCRMYKGKLILRIEDTNPKNIDPKAYRLIPEDARWVTKNNIHAVILQSDRMKTYYKWAEKILERGFGYVCICNPEKWKSLMLKSKACPDREKRPEIHLARWKNMLSGKLAEGSAVVRIKTDLFAKNPALRDWPALRIVKAAHPRQRRKYNVWPLMNFAVAVDDYEMGITHSVRAKDHMDNEKKQNSLQKKMGWPAPVGIHVGRINFKGFELSTTKTRQAIKEGKYSGWDDPRLPFLRALRRRGYLPEALARFAIEVGPTQTDKTVSLEEFFKNINAYNREILDPVTNRYWFVPDPIGIKIEKAPEIREIRARLHPNKKAFRKIKVAKTLYIPKKDFEKFKGKEVRLMHLFNVKLGRRPRFTSVENKDIQKLQWLSSDSVGAELLMPDNSVTKGLAESNIKTLKVGTIVQFERVGFARLDKKRGGKFVFVFAHK